MTDLKGFLNKYSVAVITGGSSGIGLEFVKRLLALQPELLLINLSRSRAEDNWDGLPVLHRQVDLASPAELDEASQWLADKCTSAPPGQLLLINNSGFGSYGRFPAREMERQLDMIEVNVAAPVHLTGLLLPEIKKRGGGIIFTSSLAAFQPTPYLATYGATKTFLLFWALALEQEVKHDNVRVLSLCPGPTNSNFFKNAGFTNLPGGSSSSATTVEVVDCALQAYCKGKSIMVPGVRNKFVAFAVSFMPRKIRAVVAETVLRKLRLENYLKHQ